MIFFVCAADLASKLNNNIRSERTEKAGEEDEKKWWAKRSLQESALILGLCVDYVMLFPNLGEAFRTWTSRQKGDKKRATVDKPLDSRNANKAIH